MCKVLPEQIKQFVDVKVSGPHSAVKIYANGRLVESEQFIFNPKSEGNSLQFLCKGEGGYPTGKVQWTHGDFTNSSDRIIIKDINRKSSGLYQCLVDNGHGKPAHGAVNLIVERKL